MAKAGKKAGKRTNHGSDNARRIVEALTLRGPQTRGQLSARLGISEATVRKWTKRLNRVSDNSRGNSPAIYDLDPKQAQLPEKALEGVRNRTGKQAKVLMLGPRAGFAVGIEIGRAHLSVGVGDPNGCLLGSPAILNEEHSIEKVSAPKTFEKVARLVKKQLADCGIKPAEVRGVGVSIPGPVGLDGRTLNPNISACFHDLDIPARMKAELLKTVGVKAAVFIENDVDVLARGEQRYGKGYGRRDFIAVKYSGGIGAGIVADERLVRGRGGGGAGEIGHCRVSPEALVADVPYLGAVAEPQCKCQGFSHLEAFAGGDAIVAHLHDLQKKASTKLDSKASVPAQLDQAMDLARKDEQPYKDVVNEAGAMVGYALTILINLFNPERVLICGKLSEMGEPFLTAIQEECRSQKPLFGDARIIELGAGTTLEERRRISVGGAVTTALRKSAVRLRYPK